jgi:hypothetical protein
MAIILAFKRGRTFRAADNTDEAVLAKIPEGALVKIEIKRPRHLEHHRLYWVLMGIVWQQSDTERWPTAEDLSDSVKIMAGLRRTIFLPDGTVIYSPGSIAFHNMDQLVFAAFFDRVCDVIARDFLPGVSSQILYDEVSLIIGAAFMPQRQAA